MNRRDLVLAILGSAEGAGFSPAQLQKAVFLVDRNIPKIITEGSTFNFKPYDYGPFDSAVYKEADHLASTNLTQIETQSGATFRTYRATPSGVVRARIVLDRIDVADANYIRRCSEWVRSLNFTQLVKSIYAAYPETKKNSIFVG